MAARVMTTKEIYLQKINYDAIKQNVAFFRRKIGDCKFCAVIKNNAYGHGIVNIARHIAPYVDFWAVGNVDEAEQIEFLRKDVLILLPQNERNTERAIKAGCVLTLDSFDTLGTLKKVTTKLNLTARVHVKIDSGMSRLGFGNSQLKDLLYALQDAKISVEGIYSHFYGDSMADCDKQYMYFVRCCKVIEQKIPQPLIKHIANTSATLLSAKYHMDMVRVGLGLYGYGNDNLIPAKSVFADVVAVKQVAKGSVVGYGAKYRCNRATKIAVLNVGYARGLPRMLVGAQIRIGDKLFPIVAICMAMTLVDVGREQISVGDVATLLSRNVNISNDDVIIYELLCKLE